MSIFRVPDREPLVDDDPAMAGRLLGVLVATLRDELGRPVDEARTLADRVVWTVTLERDGTWLNLTYQGGPVIGAGGGWRSDEDGLTIHIRQIAYDLVGRQQEFEP